MIDGIRELAPPWIAELAEDDWRTRPRALHEATYREIDRIPRQRDQERVWEVWREIGGSTVSFDELARRLVRFLVGSSETVPKRPLQGLGLRGHESAGSGPHCTRSSACSGVSPGSGTRPAQSPDRAP
jgi:hypothetical protein